MDELISRQAAILQLSHNKCGNDENDIAVQHDIETIRKLPSAQPELSGKLERILDFLDTELHPIVSPEHWDVYSELHDMISMLSEPSVQPDGISLEWIDKHLEWLDNCDNDFAQLAKVGIRVMVDLWKKDRT